MSSTRTSESRGFKVTLIVLLGLAAFSSTIKDVNRLRDFVGSLQTFAGSWHDEGLLASNQKAISGYQSSCPNDASLVYASTKSGSPGVESFYDDNGVPEFGGQAEVLASKRANRSLPRLTASRPEAARLLKREMFGRIANHNWPSHLQLETLKTLKTFDRQVTLDLPMSVVTDVPSDLPSYDKLPEFTRSFVDKIASKQLHKTDNRKRELFLRRLDGNISFRRSS